MPKRSPKIKPSKINDLYESNIKPTKVGGEAKVSFNFSRLRNYERKFCYQDRESKYFLKLIERLREVCNMSRQEMTVKNRKALRCHQINFSDPSVSEDSFGFSDDDLLEDAWQFQLTSNEHGRVHGFFIESTYYVVWLDPEHQLYS